MIKSFSVDDKVFTSNGDAVINALKARVHNQDNGDFYLELECGVEYNDYIQPGRLLVVPTPQGEQAFRISTVKKLKTKLSVKAWHVYYDSANLVIADSYAVDKTCQEALRHFNANTDTTSPFTVTSDINTVDSYRCARESLQACVNVVQERWGGHLVRDNWAFGLMENIGVDNGITIEYRKNLKELTAEYNWDGVVTKILPVGQDGILLENLYVEAPISYDIPYTKVVDFEQSIDREEYETEAAYIAAVRADLLQKATIYVNTYCYPVVNYTLKAEPEKVTDIGDIIQVKDERIGVDMTTAVIAYEYDAIREKYVDLEFGSFTQKLGDLISTIQSRSDSEIITLATSLAAALKEAQQNITNVLTKGYCVFTGNYIYILDRLPIEEAERVIRFSNAGVEYSTTGYNGYYFTVWDLTTNVIDFRYVTAENISIPAENITGGDLTVDNINLLSGNIRDALYIYGETISCTDFNVAHDMTAYAIEVSGTATAYDLEITNGATLGGAVTVNGAAINHASGSDTFSGIVAFGLIRFNTVTFTFDTGKYIGSLTPSVTDLKVNIATVDGSYPFSGSITTGGYDVLADSDLTVTVTKATETSVTVNIASSNALFLDNTPVAVTVETMTLQFT